MVVFGTRAHGASKRRQIRSAGVEVHKGEWMEGGNDPALSPTIFLVEQPAGVVVPPHFHRQNQFQLFVEGGGTVGAKTLEAVTVHYAGAFTGYGPIVAGPEGVKYFTIRAVLESGAIVLPEGRPQMVQGPKRHATSAPVRLSSPAQLALLGAPQVEDVVPVADDGLGARVLRLPPGAVIQTEAPAAAAGMFMVVLSGAAVHAGGELAPWESVFSSEQGEMPGLTAGPQGADVVFLFIPAKAQVYSQ